MKNWTVVTGAGGFIGHHLVTALRKKGKRVRGVDLAHPEFAHTDADEFRELDLRKWQNCCETLINAEEVYHLAANMGGIGFIETRKGEIVRDNTQINISMLEAARFLSVPKFLFASSACVYPRYRQIDTEISPLREEEAYPADPEDGYGWEKLYMERLCRHYHEDFGLDVRIVRFHNVYGPLGTYDGGREKSPAAICRKIALAAKQDEIEVWGDGKQTRSYCFIDDCVDGLVRLMESSHQRPLNLGTDRMVSINELVDIVAKIAGKTIRKRYDPSKPQGVRGRNSDNTLLRKILKWEPSTRLEDGLEVTYRWIEEQVKNKHTCAS